MDQYKPYYDAIMSLPMVKFLQKDNRKLRKANKKLEIRVEILETLLMKLMQRDNEKPDLEEDDEDEVTVIVKKEPIVIKSEFPKDSSCGEIIVIDDDNIDEQNLENIKYQLVDDSVPLDDEPGDQEEQEEGEEEGVGSWKRSCWWKGKGLLRELRERLESEAEVGI
jgi:hypothetical protein